jgi:hypothetical protein
MKDVIQLPEGLRFVVEAHSQASQQMVKIARQAADEVLNDLQLPLGLDDKSRTALKGLRRGELTNDRVAKAIRDALSIFFQLQGWDDVEVRQMGNMIVVRSNEDDDEPLLGTADQNRGHAIRAWQEQQARGGSGAA